MLIERIIILHPTRRGSTRALQGGRSVQIQRATFSAAAKVTDLLFAGGFSIFLHHAAVSGGASGTYPS
jgi:hypothetical protein